MSPSYRWLSSLLVALLLATASTFAATTAALANPPGTKDLAPIEAHLAEGLGAMPVAGGALAVVDGGRRVLALRTSRPAADRSSPPATAPPRVPFATGQTYRP